MSTPATTPTTGLGTLKDIIETDDHKNVVKPGGELASAMRDITGDFRIGFGSFVDKEVAPSISLVAEKNCQQVLSQTEVVFEERDDPMNCVFPEYDLSDTIER